MVSSLLCCDRIVNVLNGNEMKIDSLMQASYSTALKVSRVSYEEYLVNVSGLSFNA